LPQSTPQPAAEMPYSEFSQRIENMSFGPSEIAISAPDHGPDAAAGLPEFVLRRPASPAPRFDFTEPYRDAPVREAAEQPGGVPSNGPGNSPQQPLAATDSFVRLNVPDTHGPLFPDAPPLEPENLDALRDLRPLGQIHDSFIIAAGRDGLWIIDQHVAHERILFEQVLRARRAGKPEMQGLLMPMVIQLTAAQQIEYARIADDLNAVGFETEPFGNRTIAVKSAPAGIGASDIEKVIFEILEIAERELRKASVDDLQRAMAASIACRAAIKINMKLEPAKMDWLLRSLAATSSPMSCPHGRPIALRYSTRDILKSFHRT
jgi:DNA mismatch repair protein MutL